MPRASWLARWLTVTLLPLASAVPLLAQDPCLLTLSEARELGGGEIAQASGDARRCSYVTGAGEQRLSIEIFSIDAQEAQSRLEELGDSARYTSRQKGRVTLWVSRDDELAGWVRRGERLAAVRASGEASAKRRRALEHALFRAAERLR